MNFINAFNELDRLYESVDNNKAKSLYICTECGFETELYDDEFDGCCPKCHDHHGAFGKCEDALTEDAAKDAVEDEVAISEDDVVETSEETDNNEVVDVKDYVLECTKCGALVIKAIAEVATDEESGLANVGEECAYCEESEGFKILGTFAPYDEAVVEDEAEIIEDEVIEEDEDVAESLNEGLESKVKSILEPFVALGKLRVLTNDEKRKLPQSFEIEPETAKNGVVYFQGKPFNYSVDGDNLLVTAGGLNSELEEGIFDKKKNSAEMNNARRKFESDVKLATDGKSLWDIANEIASSLSEAIHEYRYSESEHDKYTTDKESLARVFDSKAKIVLKRYEETIKSLKKPVNFVAPASVIKSTVNEILGSYKNDSSIPKKVADYYSVLNKVSKIEADKKIKAEALKKFYEKVLYKLNFDYQIIKKKPTRTFFK